MSPGDSRFGCVCIQIVTDVNVAIFLFYFFLKKFKKKITCTKQNMMKFDLIKTVLPIKFMSLG